MLATDPEPVDWLAQGVIARGYLSLLVGREKTGKSLMALAMSARCAEGGGTVAGIDCANAQGALPGLRERQAGDPSPRPSA